MSWTLVTGAAKGVGKAIVERLAMEGRDLVIHYNTSQKEAEALANWCRAYSVRAEIIQGDFSTERGVMTFIENYLFRFSETEILINNVGNYVVQTALETPMSLWRDLFETNVFAPVALTQALMPTLIQSKGSIINLGVAGLLGVRGDLHSTAYTLTKQVLYGLTLSLSKQYANKHVRVNMISPGHLENSVSLPKDLSVIPMQRPGLLSEVAALVSFLISKEAAYITGQNIEISGGLKL